MRGLGLYLHIPFCRSKCLYCDFCSFPHPTAERVEATVAALCREIDAWSERAASYTVDSIYFGGGTPTLLSESQLARLMEHLSRGYHIAADAEITAECNPATGGRSLFSRMHALGFNRLSIGVQSVHERELRALGRLHRFPDVLRTWEDARAVGFSNLSADLMFGIPEQSEESFLATLEQVCALEPTHLSAYGLIVEEGTPFARMGERLILPDEESTRRMYFSGIAYLASRGLAQYEISNFARAGYESRHNLKYWRCEPYLGFGPSAYSDFAGERFGNGRELGAYLTGEGAEESRERPTAAERMQEYVMLRMRLNEGISEEDFAERFGRSFEETFGDALRPYVKMGLVRRTERGYAFCEEGFYLSNAVLSDILDFQNDFEEK